MFFAYFFLALELARIHIGYYLDSRPVFTKTGAPTLCLLLLTFSRNYDIILQILNAIFCFVQHSLLAAIMAADIGSKMHKTHLATTIRKRDANEYSYKSEAITA